MYQVGERLGLKARYNRDVNQTTFRMPGRGSCTWGAGSPCAECGPRAAAAAGSPIPPSRGLRKACLWRGRSWSPGLMGASLRERERQSAGFVVDEEHFATSTAERRNAIVRGVATHPPITGTSARRALAAPTLMR